MPPVANVCSRRRPSKSSPSSPSGPRRTTTRRRRWLSCSRTSRRRSSCGSRSLLIRPSSRWRDTTSPRTPSTCSCPSCPRAPSSTSFADTRSTIQEEDDLDCFRPLGWRPCRSLRRRKERQRRSLTTRRGGTSPRWPREWRRCIMLESFTVT